MKYKIVVFDMDGTLTKHVSSWQCLHEQFGVWDTLACKYQEQFLSGQISYRKFCELDAAHWKGIAVKEIKRILHTIPYTKNAQKVVRNLKNDGLKTAILSTGLALLAEKVKEDFGIDYCKANKLYEENGVLTGKVKISLSDRDKGKVLTRLIAGLNIKPSEVIFVGDGKSDIPPAKIAGLAIAFNSRNKEFCSNADYVCKSDDFYEVYDCIKTQEL